MSHLSGVKGNANDVDECSLVAQTSTLHCAPQDVLHAQNVNDHPEMKVPNVSQVMEKINQKTVLVQKKILSEPKFETKYLYTFRHTNSAFNIKASWKRRYLKSFFMS